MGYNAFSVADGEIPSAVKWNYLGANDASFYDMTGLPNTLKGINRQDDTTNNTVSDQLIQTGWGWKAGDGVNRYITEAITFPVAYDSAPIVYAVFTGLNATTNPDSLDDLSGVSAFMRANAYAATTTGFTVVIARSTTDGNDPGLITAATRCGYSWMAVGTKAR